MTLHDDYGVATADALGFLTAVRAKEPEAAADIYDDTPDQGLLAWVLAQMYLGSLEEVAERSDCTVEEMLGAMGQYRAEAWG